MKTISYCSANRAKAWNKIFAMVLIQKNFDVFFCMFGIWIKTAKLETNVYNQLKWQIT